MKKFWNKLKIRWGISSDWQVAIILLVFALTGFSTLYTNKLIDSLLGMNEDSPFWLEAIVFLIIVLPVYNLLLLFWGIVLGQYKFFSNFIMNFIRRIFFIKKKDRH